MFKLSHEPTLYLDIGHRRECIAWADDRLVFVGYDPETLQTCGIQIAPGQDEGEWKQRLWPHLRAMLRAVRRELMTEGRVSVNLPEVLG